MSIEIKETNFDLDSVLVKLGYSQERAKDVGKSDVLLLPEDLNAKESYFVDKSVVVKKALDSKLKVTVVEKQGQEHHYHAQRSAEVIAPLLVFLGWQAFDISKDLLASWFYD